MDSLFSAVAPHPPIVVFITYEILVQPTIPSGATVHSFSYDAGTIPIS